MKNVEPMRFEIFELFKLCRHEIMPLLFIGSLKNIQFTHHDNKLLTIWNICCSCIMSTKLSRKYLFEKCRYNTELKNVTSLSFNDCEISKSYRHEIVDRMQYLQFSHHVDKLSKSIFLKNVDKIKFKYSIFRQVWNAPDICLKFGSLKYNQYSITTNYWRSSLSWNS